MDEKYIQFIANYDDWVAIKKLKIEPAIDPRTVMQFLASLAISLDKKVEDNMRKVVSLEKVDEALKEIQAGKKAEDIAKIMAEASSGKVNRIIKEIVEATGFQPKERKELEEFCKVYALKKAMKEAGLYSDYSAISLNIPGMKKSMLKKAK